MKVPYPTSNEQKLIQARWLMSFTVGWPLLLICMTLQGVMLAGFHHWGWAEDRMNKLFFLIPAVVIHIFWILALYLLYKETPNSKPWMKGVHLVSYVVYIAQFLSFFVLSFIYFFMKMLIYDPGTYVKMASIVFAIIVYLTPVAILFHLINFYLILRYLKMSSLDWFMSIGSGPLLGFMVFIVLLGLDLSGLLPQGFMDRIGGVFGFSLAAVILGSLFILGLRGLSYAAYSSYRLHRHVNRRWS